MLFILETIANALIIGGVVLLLLTVWPTAFSEGRYWFKKAERSIKCALYKLPCEEGPESLFAPLANSPTPLKVEPVSKSFSIIIEKIGVNAPVIENVPPEDKTTYMEAMRRGVAHAKGTATPDKPGNTYLFAHSSLNFWELGKYATVFNLLRKAETGDRITIFYKGTRYDYKVVEKRVVSGFNTEPLLKKVNEHSLTLQTCHPPGTTLNRLIVTAELKNKSQSSGSK